MISSVDIEDMTDAQDEAPERIWLKFVAGTITKSRNNKPMDDGTEFIRADLARPSQAGDENAAVVAYVISRLSKSAKAALAQKKPGQRMHFDRGLFPYHDCEMFGLAIEIQPHMWQLTPLGKAVRSALAAMDTPKGGGDE